MPEAGRNERVINVADIGPQHRHAILFRLFEHLPPGRSLQSLSVPVATRAAVAFCGGAVEARRPDRVAARRLGEPAARAEIQHVVVVQVAMQDHDLALIGEQCLSDFGRPVQDADLAVMVDADNARARACEHGFAEAAPAVAQIARARGRRATRLGG